MDDVKQVHKSDSFPTEIPDRSSTVRGVDLLDPRQEEHDLSSIIRIYLRRIVARLPDGIPFEVKSVELLQGNQLIQIFPGWNLIVIALNMKCKELQFSFNMDKLSPLRQTQNSSKFCKCLRFSNFFILFPATSKIVSLILRWKNQCVKNYSHIKP